MGSRSFYIDYDRLMIFESENCLDLLRAAVL